MKYNTEDRMKKNIISILTMEGFNIFETKTSDTGSDIIIRTIYKNSPIYTEVQILSRTQEYVNPLIIPTWTITENNEYYFILYSLGMNKYWLLKSDELIKLRKEGLDTRDTSPYLVKNFKRLEFPKLYLKEFKKLNN